MGQKIVQERSEFVRVIGHLADKENLPFDSVEKAASVLKNATFRT
jgi:hypothetical protein